MSEISKRKDQHLDIVLGQDVGPGKAANLFDSIRFEHQAMPELSLAEIDLSREFLGRRLAAPLLISSMTGGPDRAASINAALAEAAQTVGVAFAVGSQRIAIEGLSSAGFGSGLRKRAPDVPILANIGAAQVAAWPDPATALRAIEMIDADALIVHFNPLQEAVQRSGDTDWRLVRRRLAALVQASPVPVIAKEVGCGISAETARQLVELGVSIIDVAGQGGTSWAAVEARRAQERDAAEIAEAFRDWGIPTPLALVEVRRACPEIPLIASGGVRNGLDVAKAIRLGATLVGQAANLLDAALTGPDAVVRNLEVTAQQLRITCFCTGSRSLDELQRAPLIANGPDALDHSTQRAGTLGE